MRILVSSSGSFVCSCLLMPTFLCCCYCCAARFVAFFTVAFVTYYMRTRFGYRSLPEAIHARYGGVAALAFGLAVAYRCVQAAKPPQTWKHCVCQHGVAVGGALEECNRHRSCRVAECC